jgi:hypothetical protein
MGTSRQITEGQLQQAKSDLEARAKALEGKGIAKEKHRRDPQWRSLDAKVRQITGRLRHITEVETIDSELKKSKEDSVARRAARRAERKAARTAAKKPEKSAKAEKPKGEKAPKKEKAPKDKKAKE